MGGEMYSNQPLAQSTPHPVVEDLCSALVHPVAKIASYWSQVPNADHLCAGLPEGCRIIRTVNGRLPEIMTPTA